MVAYAEMKGYPQERYGENGQFYAERKLKCAWADRYAVIFEVAANGGHFYPYATAPLAGFARAIGAGIIPFARQTSGSSSPIAAYDHAIITVKYSTTTAVKLSDTWVTEELEPTSHAFNADTKGLLWENDSTPIDPGEIVKLVTSFDYLVTYWHLTGVPPAAYTNCGKVNSGVVSSWLLDMSFAAETLRYTRPIVKRSFDPGLLNTFELKYRFSVHPQQTWNHFWNAGIMDWDRPTRDGEVVKPYLSFNFTSLMP